LSGKGLIAYYLHLILNLIGFISDPQQLRINCGLTVLNLCFSLALASLMEVADRRRLFLFSIVGMLNCYVI
jgi:hypothetical protein